MRCISNQCIKINDVVFIRRQHQNSSLSVDRSFENTITYGFSPFLFFRHGVVQIIFVFVSIFFLFYEQQMFNKINSIKIFMAEVFFLCKHIFLFLIRNIRNKY